MGPERLDRESGPESGPKMPPRLADIGTFFRNSIERSLAGIKMGPGKIPSGSRWLPKEKIVVSLKRKTCVTKPGGPNCGIPNGPEIHSTKTQEVLRNRLLGCTGLKRSVLGT